MNSIRAATSGSRAVASALSTTPRTTTRAFSRSQVKQGGHGPSYDPPSGWLFGVKPGEAYEKEVWENAIYWGFGGACAFGVVAYAFKPDTRYVLDPISDSWMVMMRQWERGRRRGVIAAAGIIRSDADRTRETVEPESQLTVQ